LPPLYVYPPMHSKKTCAINQPPTGDQGHYCFYDRPANRKPKCAKAEDREQNPERFCLSAQSWSTPLNSAAFRCLAIHEPARQRARKLVNTPEFANAQRQRKKVEALFAELKNQIGLRRLRLRRMKFVREQFFLAAAAQNIKRLVRFLSQGQMRPKPRLCRHTPKHFQRLMLLTRGECCTPLAASATQSRPVRPALPERPESRGGCL
jgi:Transposase DDE domain